MSRVPSLSSPFLLDSTKSSVRSIASSKVPTVIRPTISSGVIAATASPNGCESRLAVAGFTRDQLDITIEENQLVIRAVSRTTRPGNTSIAAIAARHFQRTFVLAEGMQCWART